MAKYELEGRKFGRLTAIRDSGERQDGKVMWECICDCGRPTMATSGHLVSGHTQSCGCYQSDRAAASATKHGKHGTPEYGIWKAMKGRCYYKRHISWKHYGERGVVMCDAWLNDFQKFFDDMGHRPSPAHSIDRIDSDGPYSPDNCRWATNTQQAQNNRNAKLSKAKARRIRELCERGISVVELAKRFGVARSTIYNVVNWHSWKNA